MVLVMPYLRNTLTTGSVQGPPSAVTTLSAVASTMIQNAIDLSWSAPASSGRAAIISYLIIVTTQPPSSNTISSTSTATTNTGGFVTAFNLQLNNTSQYTLTNGVYKYTLAVPALPSGVPFYYINIEAKNGTSSYNTGPVANPVPTAVPYNNTNAPPPPPVPSIPTVSALSGTCISPSTAPLGSLTITWPTPGSATYNSVPIVNKKIVATSTIV